MVNTLSELHDISVREAAHSLTLVKRRWLYLIDSLVEDCLIIKRALTLSTLYVWFFCGSISYIE
jgi:hypothetical protein